MNAEIYVYEEIGGFGLDAKTFAKKLSDLGRISAVDLRLNSPGGDVFDGIAIYNLLKNSPATVNVYVDGLAASIASIIAMAGDTITMADNSLMMVHDPLAMTYGNADEMRALADLLDKVKDETLVPTYVNRTGLDAKKVAKLMADETWLSAKESVDLGFATAIGAGKQMGASVDNKWESMLARFKNCPKCLLEKAAPTPPPDPKPEPTKPEPVDLSDFENRLALMRMR